MDPFLISGFFSITYSHFLFLIPQAVKDCKTDSCVPDDLRNMSLPNVRNVLLLYGLVSAAATLNSVLFQLDIRYVWQGQIE